MKLSEWLEREKAGRGLTRVEFAESIGVTPQAITGWCDGSFWITKDKAQKVFDATGGEVTPTDFMQTEKGAA